MQTSSLAYAETEPVRVFARKRHISPTKVYDWINQGLIESFIDGNRRHVVVSSYDRMVRRKVAEQQGGNAVKLTGPNPKLRDRASNPSPSRSTKSTRRGASAI